MGALLNHVRDFLSALDRGILTVDLPDSAYIMPLRTAVAAGEEVATAHGVRVAGCTCGAIQFQLLGAGGTVFAIATMSALNASAVMTEIGDLLEAHLERGQAAGIQAGGGACH